MNNDYNCSQPKIAQLNKASMYGQTHRLIITGTYYF
jgi:hypothetical protein